MKIKLVVLFTASLICCLIVFPGSARHSTVLGQNIDDGPHYATLVKRVKTDIDDNYTQSAFSFKYGINGDGGLKLNRNNWDPLFGNSPTPGAFDGNNVLRNDT